MSKVLVIGDSCVDIFEYGNCKRICPEAPVPVLIPTKKTENYGMAYNVCQNLRGLNIDCDIVTNDIMPHKERYIDESSNQMIIRIDRDDTIIPLSWERLKSIDFSSYETVVISDYNKGYLNIDHIQYIAETHKFTIMDSKKQMGEWCNNIKCLKINEKEYNENKNYLSTAYPHDVIITMGKNGAKLIYNILDIPEETLFPIVHEHPVRDLTGAGDTFLAGLVANYLETKNIWEAVKFANRCASWAVTQKGVSVVTMDKLKNNGYK